MKYYEMRWLRLGFSTPRCCGFLKWGTGFAVAPEDRHHHRVHRRGEALQEQRLGRDVLPPLRRNRGPGLMDGGDDGDDGLHEPREMVIVQISQGTYGDLPG